MPRLHPIGTPLRGQVGSGRVDVTGRWEQSHRRGDLVHVRLTRE